MIIFRLITISTNNVDLLSHAQDDPLLTRYLSGKKPISKLQLLRRLKHAVHTRKSDL